MNKILILLMFNCGTLFSQIEKYTKEISTNLEFLKSRETEKRRKGVLFFMKKIKPKEFEKYKIQFFQNLGIDSSTCFYDESDNCLKIDSINLHKIYNIRFNDKDFENFYHEDYNNDILIGNVNLEQKIINKMIGMDNQIKVTYLEKLILTKEIAKAVFRMFLIDEDWTWNYRDGHSLRHYYIGYLSRYFNQGILKLTNIDKLNDEGAYNRYSGETNFTLFKNPLFYAFINNELKLDSVEVVNALNNWDNNELRIKIHDKIFWTYFKKIKEFCSKEFELEYNRNYKEKTLFTYREAFIPIYKSSEEYKKIGDEYKNENELKSKLEEEKLQKEKEFIDQRMKKNKEDAKKYLEQEAEKERIFNQKPEAERKKIKDDIKKAQDEHLKAQELERQKYIKDHPEIFKDK